MTKPKQPTPQHKCSCGAAFYSRAALDVHKVSQGH